jgi:hypothetical protein
MTILLYVNNFEPNPVLVNINKLKPYKYVDWILKGIQSSKNQKSLEFIYSDHRKEKSDEDLEDERILDIIDINQIVTLEEALVNLMSQHAMILLRNHDYIISQPINYRLNMFVTSKQNFVDLMTQRRIEEIYSVDNTRSLELEVLSKEPSALSTKLLGQRTLTIAHIAISMNSNRSQQVSKNKKNGHVIKTLTLKQKAKHNYTK